MGRHGASHRLDSSHREIMEGVRGEGIAIVSTAQLGGFLGDAIAAFCGNILLEFKPTRWRGPRDDRERRQQAARIAWRAAGGQIEVARTLAEALEIIRSGGAARPTGVL